MSTKDWKNKELTTLLSEAWGFKFNTLQEFDEFNEGADKNTGMSDDEGAPADKGDDKDDTYMGHELQETGAKDDGESAGDKGKDKEDPDDRDYSGHGERKGDESDTHKGDKDYINEDSGYEEKEHDEHNAWKDEDHIDAIEKHLSALKHDRDYEEDHESLEEGEDADLEELAGVATKDSGRRTPRLQKNNRPSEPEDDEEKDELREAIKALLGKYIKG